MEVGNNVKLYIVGNPNVKEYYHYLLNIVKDLGLNKEVIFTGEVNKKKLKTFYSTCRLFVYSSLCESSGFALTEAMSCGSPILASNRTAIPYTCAEAAIYFDPENIEQLSSKIQLMLNKDYNLNHRKKLSLQPFGNRHNSNRSRNSSFIFPKQSLPKNHNK